MLPVTAGERGRASPPLTTLRSAMAERLEDDVNKFGTGQPVPRVEDPRFITGRGRYVDDFELPHQAYGVVVMSPHAHARIKGVDTAKAKAADGVLAVLTGADVVADKDATDAAFAAAKHVVTLKLNNSRITANSIETRAAIGHYHPDGDSYTLYSTSQNPHGTRSSVAGQVLKIPETKLRVISPDVGGGFGMKHGGYPEDALVVWASRRVGGRPVKWVSTRSEALLGDSQGRDQVVTGELALDQRGKVLGLRVNALHAMGSHVFGASMVVPLFAMRLAPGVYQIPAVHCVGK